MIISRSTLRSWQTICPFTLNPDNLSFNHSSDNWSTPQTVLVLSNDDFVDEGISDMITRPFTLPSIM